MTDDRALLDAFWTATVSSTAFTNTTPATTAPAIPATDVYYFSGAKGTTIATGAAPTSALLIAPGQTGTAPTSGITTGTTPPGSNGGAAQLGGGTVDAMTLTGAVGANQVTWHPTIAVDVPTTAVSGDYLGTITHSVS